MQQYKDKIPLDTNVVKLIIKAIENADYLYCSYLQEEKFPTNNGSEGAKWNYINREVERIWKRGDTKSKFCVADHGNFWEYMIVRPDIFIRL